MVIVGAAFALGLHSLLRHSRETCDEEGNAYEFTCNDRFILRNIEVGVYCQSADDGLQTPCPVACWTAFAANPGDQDSWDQPCQGMTPKLEAVDGNGRFVLSHFQVGLYCQPTDGGLRRPCTQMCWAAFAANPGDQASWDQSCQGMTPKMVENGGDGSSLFPDLGEESNRFRGFVATLAVLFWSIFDPGHPEVVGCSEGVARAAGLLLWACYNIVVVIVLLNVRKRTNINLLSR